MSNNNAEQRPNQGTSSSSTATEPATSDAPQLQPATPGTTKGKDKKGPSWIKRQAQKYKSIELENTGSVARDHLALERTFLAWLRTSLAFASIGVAVTQLFRLNSTISPDQASSSKREDPYLELLFTELLNIFRLGPSTYANNCVVLVSSPMNASTGSESLKHMGRPLGATFLGIAVVVLVMGMHRYFESQTWLLKGKFPASRGSILLLTLIAALLIVCSLIIVLVIKPS